MTATVHKILVHSSDILENTVLPVGYFGEEGAESRNKFYKSDRLHHARKCSRAKNFEDVFQRAMDTSDPIISSLNLEKRIKKQRRQCLPTEVLELLSSASNNLPENSNILDESYNFFENYDFEIPFNVELENEEEEEDEK